MPRIARLVLPGSIYHCIARGNDRQTIFRDDKDRQFYLKLWSLAVPRFELLVHAFVLMPNHVHFLIQALTGRLSQAFHWVHGSYAGYFNVRHRRTGHLFEQRYKTFWVDTLSYFLNASVYINKNPVKAGMVERAIDFLWSSARALAGMEPAPPWLEMRKTIEVVGSLEAYRELCASSSSDEDLEDVRKGILGEDAYVLSRLLEEPVIDADLLAPRGPLVSAHAMADAVAQTERGTAMFLLREVSGLSLSDLSAMFDLTAASVSRNVSRARQRLLVDPAEMARARELVSASRRR